MAHAIVGWFLTLANTMSTRLGAWLFLTLIVSVIATWARADETSPAPEQVQSWIGQLSAERFADRELATQKLIDAGQAAIVPVAALVNSPEREAAERALFVLRKLAVADDEATEDAARTVLERLARDEQARASRRARQVLAEINLVRQDRAIAAIRRLGGTVEESTYNQFIGVWQLVTQYNVTIGEGWTGGEQGLKYLRWLPELQSLTLRGPQVGDAWLKSLEGIEKLNMVEVNRADISDAGISVFKSLPNLRVLSLKYSPVTDQAVDDLKQIKVVSVIRLYGTKITTEGADVLRAAGAEANVQIDYRRGGFLGIGCQQTEAGCTISQVHPDSAAEKAGIQAGDIVLEYDGQVVSDFMALTALIGKNSAGDKVKIKLRRGESEELTKEMVLGEWE
jgi:hypothetical protein